MFDELTLDSRAVSETIGAILVFGLLVAVISVIQVQAVPDANAEIEFDHSQEVTNDMANLRVATWEAVASGNSREAAVKLGVDYPARLLFYNPPPASGRLSTTDRANITVENVTSSTQAGTLFDNVPVYRVGTKALTYDINYNVYGSEPVRTLEPTAYYERFDNETLVKSSSFIDGREISLVAVGGNYSEGGVTAEAVTAKSLSGPMSEYEVSNNASGPINVTVPTKLSLEKWNETLSDEYTPSGASVNGSGTVAGNGHISAVRYKPRSGEFNHLTVVLEPGQYTFRTAKVGFGTGGDPGPRYLTTTVTDKRSTAGVIVRDEFHNPVGGVTLWANTSSGTLSNGTVSAQSVRVTTGPNGVATVERVGATATTVEFSEDLNNSGTVEPKLEELDGFFGGKDAPIVLGDASQANNDELTIELVNTGSTRQISSITLAHISYADNKTVAGAPSLVGGTACDLASLLTGSCEDASLTATGTTALKDGPDKITELNGTSTNIVEKSGPVVLSSGPTVPSGSSQLTLQFDEEVPLDTDSGDAIILEMTIVYDSGYSETYSVQLFANEA
ncbi:Ig-like domain-containing protein [Halorarius halobius]|uniref:Ig-like domain-containing protein n=1 Tax=Halorarius halobius TaxID=2962671 RepID=UPI0020CB8671|nr:Ig-like domain-containing protein [Halorarius halobius]